MKNVHSDALRDLVPFVQFKKREKTPWKCVTFSILCKGNAPSWVFFTFFRLYKWYQIAQRPHIQWPFGFCCTVISEFINSMQCLYLLSCLFYIGIVLHISCFYIRVIIAENYMYLVKDRSCYFDFFW